MRSTPEWMASEITDTAPIISPTMSLKITSNEFDSTESLATCRLRWADFIGIIAVFGGQIQNY